MGSETEISGTACESFMLLLFQAMTSAKRSRCVRLENKDLWQGPVPALTVNWVAAKESYQNRDT